MDPQERKRRVAERISRALGEKFGEDFRRLSPADPLQESGLDSVDMLDALAELEKLFRITFDRDELVGIGTLEELFEVVHDRLVEERGEDFEIE